MSPTPRARALGKELRAARKANGFSCRSLAEKLDWSPSKVSRTERALHTPTEAEVGAVCALLRITGEELERLLKIVREIDQPAWWEFGLELSTQFTALVDAEQRARRITHASTMLIPGLLQTRTYTRSLLARNGTPVEKVEDYVSVRQVRQNLLSQENAPELVVYVDEAGLARTVGNAAVMSEQLQHLAASGRRSNITLRVVPFSGGAHPAMSGGFCVLDFTRGEPVVHVEQRHSAAFLSKSEETLPFVEAVDLLNQYASSPDESAEVIAEYRKKYESEAQQ